MAFLRPSMSTRSLSNAILVPSGDQSENMEVRLGFEVSLFNPLPLGLALKISRLSVASTNRTNVIRPLGPLKVADDDDAINAPIAMTARRIAGGRWGLQALFDPGGI
jgi:hypothetical protein